MLEMPQSGLGVVRILLWEWATLTVDVDEPYSEKKRCFTSSRKPKGKRRPIPFVDQQAPYKFNQAKLSNPQP
jgi:hypothetical protein